MDRLETRRRNESDHRAARQAAGGIKKILVASRDFASLDRICSALSPQSDYQMVCTSRVDCGVQSHDFDEFALLTLDIDDLADLAGLVASVSRVKPATVWICSEKNVVRLIQAAQCEQIPISSNHIVLKPVSPDAMLDAVRIALREKEQTSLLAEKYRKMRQLVRRVVRERREINRRVELVCRDLVEAHRQLTYRFVQMHKSAS